MEKSGHYFLLKSDDNLELMNLSQSKKLNQSSGEFTKVNQPQIPIKSTPHMQLSQTSQPRSLYTQSSNTFSHNYLPPSSTPSASSESPTFQNLLKINCSKCKLELAYRDDAYCVSCYECSTLTAVKTLSTHLCLICLTNIFYLANQKLVKCRCGKVYDMSKSPSF